MSCDWLPYEYLDWNPHELWIVLLVYSFVFRRRFARELHVLHAELYGRWYLSVWLIRGTVVIRRIWVVVASWRGVRNMVVLKGSFQLEVSRNLDLGDFVAVFLQADVVFDSLQRVFWLLVRV